ncbi:MAG TPA: Lrp/AsnC ligand binding domain-containing protein [Nitrospiria bacterium]|nr:Lrp/AsnC ligand binding domain-containing protein [Nitrospiria bacterium]
MIAYVLLKTRAGRSKSLVDYLQTLEGVEEAAAVYGGADVIVKVEVSDSSALARLIMEKIQGIASVESTQTLIVVEGMASPPE